MRNEIEEVRKYVKERPLYRPKTSKSILFIYLFTWLIASSFSVFFIWLLCYDSFSLQIWSWEFMGLTIIVSALLCIGCYYLTKRLLIIVVECYQHYASEETRRSCMCMPTCSEYAILVLKLYSLPLAIYMIYVRLTKTCKDRYLIDYPGKYFN